MNDFLPADYEVPKGTGSYMKLKQGANKLRILSAPVIGYEYWTEDRKPVRARDMWKVIPLDADISGQRGWDPKHFWAMAVYNFDEKAIQILQITQTTILRRLQDLIKNPDWGDPRTFSLTINKTGEKLSTEYSVDPSPHKPVPDEITKAYQDKKINLNALFDGKNPFEGEDGPEKNADDFAPQDTDEVPVEFNPADVPF